MARTCLLLILTLLPSTSAFVLAPRTPAVQPLRSCAGHVSMKAPTKVATLVKNAATLAVCASLLVGPAPALAKGGGHGGGHSSSHSSHSSSSHSTSMSRSYSPRATSSRSSSSYSTPRATSSRSSSSRSGRTRSGRTSRSTSRGSGGLGTGTVSPPPPRRVYVDSGPTVVVERSPTVVVDRSPVVVDSNRVSFWDGVWTGRAEAATIAGLASYFYSHTADDDDDDDDPVTTMEPDNVSYWQELKATRELINELKAEFDASDQLAAAIERPVDGEYQGESAEDDGGDQSVTTSLVFARDGTLRGSGDDAVDGRYSISEGRWSAQRVAWVEKYDEGFEVALRGQRRPDGSIRALWASSVGVAGSVELRAPRRR